MSHISKFVLHYLDAAWDRTHWLMMEMDLTQWGIVAVVFVISGFAALRTRL